LGKNKIAAIIFYNTAAVIAINLFCYQTEQNKKDYEHDFKNIPANTYTHCIGIL